jgi:hypothetical protein
MIHDGVSSFRCLCSRLAPILQRILAESSGWKKKSLKRGLVDAVKDSLFTLDSCVRRHNPRLVRAKCLAADFRHFVLFFDRLLLLDLFLYRYRTSASISTLHSPLSPLTCSCFDTPLHLLVARTAGSRYAEVIVSSRSIVSP